MGFGPEGTAKPPFFLSDPISQRCSYENDIRFLFRLAGYVRPDDEPTDIQDVCHEGGTGEGATVVRETAVIPLGGAQSTVPQTVEDEGDTIRPLPEKLTLELTAFRTIALRDAVARNPRIAMTLLLHKLVSDTFDHRHGGSCLQVFVSHPNLYGKTQKNLDETVPAASMAHRRSLWGDVVPGDDQALWDWLEGETDDVRAELLAFCVSYGMNALMERGDNYGAGPSQHAIDCRFRHAMRVAAAIRTSRAKRLMVSSSWLRSLPRSA